MKCRIIVFVFLLNSFFSFLFAAPIKRIVSLAPSLSMNLYYLDAKQELVGCTSYCEIAKPDKKEIVGSAVTVNIEKIVRLKPDLVVATTITSPETIDMLRKIGIRVEVFPIPKSFDEICTQFLKLGTIIGKEAKAKTVITETKAKVNKIKASHINGIKPKVFLQIGAKPLFTVIPNTFMNDYILFCGGVNIASDLKMGSIGREAVLKRNPDVIFIVTMGIIGEEEKAVWENYADLKAKKNKQIFAIDSNLACTPTPISFLKTLEQINSLIYKK